MNYDKVKDDFDIMDAALREVIEASLQSFTTEYEKNRDVQINIENSTPDYKIKVVKCDVPASPTLVAILMILDKNDVVTRIYEFHIKDM